MRTCKMLTLYDKMATYEEKDLTRILGEEYEKYKKKCQNGLLYGASKKESKEG